MASGSNQSLHGNYTGTGASATLALGFYPRSVRVTSEADGAEFWWDEGMDHEGWARDAAGAVTKFGAGAGFVRTDSGFTLGTGALNASGVSFFYRACD